MVTLPLEKMATRVAMSLCHAASCGEEMVVSRYVVKCAVGSVATWLLAKLGSCCVTPLRDVCELIWVLV
jgi:hypothetical protein